MTRLKLLKALSACAVASGVVMGIQGPARAMPYEYAGSYPTRPECVAAGDQGVADQSWTAYRCILFEGLWDLYTKQP